MTWVPISGGYLIPFPVCAFVMTSAPRVDIHRGELAGKVE